MKIFLFDENVSVSLFLALIFKWFSSIFMCDYSICTFLHTNRISSLFFLNIHSNMFPNTFLHFSVIRYDFGSIKSCFVIKRYPTLNFTIYFVFLNQNQLFFRSWKHVVSEEKDQILEVFSIEITGNHKSSVHSLIPYKRTFFTVKWILRTQSNSNWNRGFSKWMDIPFLKNEIIIVWTRSGYVHKFSSWDMLSCDDYETFVFLIVRQESLRIITLSKIVYKRNESTSFFLFSCHVLNM